MVLIFTLTFSINYMRCYDQIDYTEFAELAESEENSLRIIHELILIPFYRFSQSKITRILFSSNSAFSFVVLYLKTKTRNSRKVSKSFKNLLNQCSIVVAVHRLVTCYQCLYTQITFPTYFYPFELVFKQKIEKWNCVCPSGSRY